MDVEPTQWYIRNKFDKVRLFSTPLEDEYFTSSNKDDDNDEDDDDLA